MALNGYKNTFKFNENFMKNYNEKTDKRYILEVDAEYSKNLHSFHNDLTIFTRNNKN